MQFFSLLSEAFTNWRSDKVPQLAASTAYYTIFSLAPMLVLIIAVLGFFFDEASSRAVVLQQISGLIGDQGAEAIGSMVDAARRSTSSVLAATIGAVVLLVGATGVMLALQDAMNFIWKVKPKAETNSYLIAITKRIFSLAFILGIGFLLLVSLIVSAGLTAFSVYLQQYESLSIVLPVANTFVSMLVISVGFATLFKFMPDVRLQWKDVLPGAFLTAVLFVVGKSLLGWYLGRTDAVTAYGVAGSLIVVLLWINYSSQVFFFGVEFTKVYAISTRGNIAPKGYAEATEPQIKILKAGFGAKVAGGLSVIFLEFRLLKIFLKVRAMLRRKR